MSHISGESANDSLGIETFASRQLNCGRKICVSKEAFAHHWTTQPYLTRSAQVFDS
jgi:hypothetical protein